MRTILPVDFYIEMMVDGDMIGAYIVMHDCDGHGTCGTAIHTAHVNEHKLALQCDQCHKIGVVQQ